MIPNPIKSFSKCSVLAILTVFSYSACQLDDTTPNPPQPHNYASFETYFQEQGQPTSSENFGASDAIDFSSESGTRIQIDAANLVDSNGAQPMDSVKITLTELPANSDLIKADLSLVDDSDNLLKIAKLFSVSAKTGNQALGLDGNLKVNFSNAGTAINDVNDLTVFQLAGGLQMPMMEESAEGAITLSGNDFELTTDELGWTLAAKQNSYNNNTTTISLDLNFNDEVVTSPRAYIVFNDFKGIKKMTQDGNTFSTNGIPKGVSATVVALAMDEIFFYIATEEITTSENQSIALFPEGYQPIDFLTLLEAID